MECTLSAAPGAVGQVVNVGTTELVTINDLARKIIDMTGSKSSIQHISYEEAYGRGFEDMSRRVPDITRIRNLIGFEPRTPLPRTSRRRCLDASNLLRRRLSPVSR